MLVKAPGHARALKGKQFPCNFSYIYFGAYACVHTWCVSKHSLVCFNTQVCASYVFTQTYSYKYSDERWIPLLGLELYPSVEPKFVPSLVQSLWRPESVCLEECNQWQAYQSVQCPHQSTCLCVCMLICAYTFVHDSALACAQTSCFVFHAGANAQMWHMQALRCAIVSDVVTFLYWQGSMLDSLDTSLADVQLPRNVLLIHSCCHCVPQTCTHDMKWPWPFIVICHDLNWKAWAFVGIACILILCEYTFVTPFSQILSKSKEGGPGQMVVNKSVKALELGAGGCDAFHLKGRLVHV
jgi:hypothetical protein